MAAIKNKSLLTAASHRHIFPCVVEPRPCLFYELPSCREAIQDSRTGLGPYVLPGPLTAVRPAGALLARPGHDCETRLACHAGPLPPPARQGLSTQTHTPNYPCFEQDRPAAHIAPKIFTENFPFLFWKNHFVLPATYRRPRLDIPRRFGMIPSMLGAWIYPRCHPEPSQPPPKTTMLSGSTRSRETLAPAAIYRPLCQCISHNWAEQVQEHH